MKSRYGIAVVVILVLGACAYLLYARHSDVSPSPTLSTSTPVTTQASSTSVTASSTSNSALLKEMGDIDAEVGNGDSNSAAAIKSLDNHTDGQ